jgi:hypothetical protein
MSIYRDISIYYILYTMLYICGCDHFGGCDPALCTYVAYKLRKKFRGYGMICVFWLCLAISVTIQNCAKSVFCAIFQGEWRGFSASPVGRRRYTLSPPSKTKRGMWHCANIRGAVYIISLILRSNIYVNITIPYITLRVCY